MYKPGEEFAGRYELKEPLGKGGFGEVWKAYDHTIEEHVAIKIVGGGEQMSRELVEACSSEYKATLKIHHPHLPIYRNKCLPPKSSARAHRVPAR